MNQVTTSLLVCAVLLFGANALPQDNAPASPNDELAATLKVCGKPLGIESEHPEKFGDSRKVVDYPGVSLWFRKDDKASSDYSLHTAMRNGFRSPFVLDRGELTEALPCSRYVHYRRLREVE